MLTQDWRNKETDAFLGAEMAIPYLFHHSTTSQLLSHFGVVLLTAWRNLDILPVLLCYVSNMMLASKLGAAPSSATFENSLKW